jgi:hypothetical protein
MQGADPWGPPMALDERYGAREREWAELRIWAQTAFFLFPFSFLFIFPISFSSFFLNLNSNFKYILPGIFIFS